MWKKQKKILIQKKSESIEEEPDKPTTLFDKLIDKISNVFERVMWFFMWF